VRKNDGQRFAIKVCLREHVIDCVYRHTFVDVSFNVSHPTPSTLNPEPSTLNFFDVSSNRFLPVFLKASLPSSPSQVIRFGASNEDRGQIQALSAVCSRDPHPGGNPGANLKSISHRCHPILVAFVWELTKETIYLPLGCLQGGASQPSRWHKSLSAPASDGMICEEGVADDGPF